MTSIFYDIRQFIRLFIEFIITLIIRKLIRITLVVALIFFASKSAYAANPDSFIGKIHYSVSSFFREQILITDETEMFQAFATKFDDMNISFSDQKTIERYFHGENVDLDNLEYDNVNNKKIALSDTAKYAKMLIGASKNINMDTVHTLIKDLDNPKKDPLDTVFEMFILMEDYIAIEKTLLTLMNSKWEEELKTVNKKSLKNALQNIKDYNSYLEEFAQENGFKLKDFKKEFSGVKGMYNYKDLQKEVAEDLGIEYDSKELEGIDAIMEYKKLQEEFKY
jgi:hypothetical protein